MYKEQLVQPLFAYKNNIYKCTQISPSSLQIRRVLWWWFIFSFFFSRIHQRHRYSHRDYPVVRVCRAWVQPFFCFIFSSLFSYILQIYIHLHWILLLPLQNRGLWLEQRFEHSIPPYPIAGSRDTLHSNRTPPLPSFLSPKTFQSPLTSFIPFFFNY